MTRCLILFAVLLLGACATQPTPSSAGTRADNIAEPSDQLPAQALPPGKCGLFLWSKDEPRRLVFFTEADAVAANAALGMGAVLLTRTKQGGRLFGQFMTESNYVAPDGGVVSLVFVPGAMLEDGQRISEGRISVIAPEGWETLIPVVGLRACQPDAAGEASARP